MTFANGNRDRKLVCLASLSLALVTLACYWPTRHFDFINLDDPVYVYSSNMVKKGLTWRGFLWAFRSVDGGNWNPLVTLSHMVDCQIYDLNAGRHHLTNVLLHMADVLLLFWVVRAMTGAIWRSAFVAALFAWHPMHVESVAWVAERKDVLSTLFFFLTIWAYVRFARRKKWGAYILAVLFFALGLMAKSMLVTMPLLLLLLDYWPLERKVPFEKLLLEKAPFILLSLAACVVAIGSQQHAGALETRRTLAVCAENAIVSYSVYLGEFFFPSNMAVFYPFPATVPLWQVFASAALIGLLTTAVALQMKSRPYLGVGWFWFLVTLVPVIGFVQVGMQAHADRYTYIPYIGLALILSWGLEEIGRARPKMRAPIVATAWFATVACVCGTCLQLRYWRNNQTIYDHALNVTGGNYIAHSNLGLMYFEKGDLEKAAAEDREVIRLMPQASKPYNNLGNVYAIQGKIDEAIPLFRKAAELEPGMAAAHLNLGTALLRQGKPRDAIPELKTALQLRPDDSPTQSRIIDAFIQAGQAAEAVKYAEEFVQADPDDAHAQFNLGWAHEKANQPDLAIVNYKESTRLSPDTPQCLNALAWMLATCPQAALRNGPEAVKLAAHACDMSKMENAEMMDTLAAAYAETGRFDDAIRTIEKMRALGESSHDTNILALVPGRLALYKAGKPYRETNSTPP